MGERLVRNEEASGSIPLSSTNNPVVDLKTSIDPCAVTLLREICGPPGADGHQDLSQPYELLKSSRTGYNCSAMRLNQITPSLRATNLKRTIDFYTQILGFSIELVWPDAENPSLVILTHESARLSFFMDDDQPHSPPTLTGQLWIDVQDVLALHASIESKVEILWGPEVYSYHRREFAIKDPNGYLLAFSELTTDPPSIPED